MNVKPGDLFFGLMDFLSFIVPGFIFCTTLPAYTGWEVPLFLNPMNENAGAFVWVCLFVASYVLGHFLHHLCAMILNPLYDKTYMRSKSAKHRTFIQAAELKIEEKLPFDKNHLKVAEAFLKMHNPSLIPDLEKHEANSKLFRSICMLSLYLCFYPGLFNPEKHWPTIGALFFISVMSFAKFANQRWTHRFLVYQYFLLANRED